MPYYFYLILSKLTAIKKYNPILLKEYYLKNPPSQNAKFIFVIQTKITRHAMKQEKMISRRKVS